MKDDNELMLSDDVVLTERDIVALGLEEAPQDAGPSSEEIAVVRQRRKDHG